MAVQDSRDDKMTISIHAFRRLPQYYNYLKLLRNAGVEQVSAPIIAKKMGLNEVQVRKDLAAVSERGGKPRTGFNVIELLRDIGRYLGYDNIQDAVLVGAGYLGSALLSYKGFEEYGVKIVAAFDNNDECVGSENFSRIIYPVDKLPDLCKRLNVRIGIITVPGESAQEICDLMVKSGIQVIWNFAPVHLLAAKEIFVQNENMAVSLALLSQHLAAHEEGAQ